MTQNYSDCWTVRRQATGQSDASLSRGTGGRWSDRAKAAYKSWQDYIIAVKGKMRLRVTLSTQSESAAFRRISLIVAICGVAWSMSVSLLDNKSLNNRDCPESRWPQTPSDRTLTCSRFRLHRTLSPPYASDSNQSATSPWDAGDFLHPTSRPKDPRQISCRTTSQAECRRGDLDPWLVHSN